VRQLFQTNQLGILNLLWIIFSRTIHCKKGPYHKLIQSPAAHSSFCQLPVLLSYLPACLQWQLKPFSKRCHNIRT